MTDTIKNCFLARFYVLALYKKSDQVYWSQTGS
jgi:hypothetical protein